MKLISNFVLIFVFSYSLSFASERHKIKVSRLELNVFNYLNYARRYPSLIAKLLQKRLPHYYDKIYKVSDKKYY